MAKSKAVRNPGLEVADQAWGTVSEIVWLEDIGTHRPKERNQFPKSREEMLRLYAEAARNRVDWGRIDRAEVEKWLGVKR